MNGETARNAELGITAEPTAGDFGHTRRRSVRLACCCCTCCCFTLLGGGIGLLAGTVKGIMAGVSHSGSNAEPAWVAFFLSCLQFIACLIGYAVAGLLLGAACGGVVDFLWFGLLQ